MSKEAVYKYMKYQNRPYSVNDISASLKDHGKTAVQKALDILVESGKILEKTYGKQKIYCFIQDTSQSTNELLRIDKDLQTQSKETESKLQELIKKMSAYENKLHDLSCSLTLEQVKEKRTQLQDSVAHFKKKLNNTKEHLSELEKLYEIKKKSESSLQTYSNVYSKRKRICTEVLNAIAENYPGKLKDLYNDIGIESVIV